MKRLALPLIALLILTSAGCSGEKTSTIAPSTDQSAATASASAAQAYTGEIMDSSCAMMGGHESMMKQAGATAFTLASKAPMYVVNAPPPEHPTAPRRAGSTSGRLTR